jgi:hypothetical protein
MRPEFTIRILTSALAAKAIPRSKNVLGILAQYSEAQSVAETLDSPQLIRELRLARNLSALAALPELGQNNRQVLWGDLLLGDVQILYKSPLPGELQSRLAIESAIARFLEYMQKVHRIAVLDESDQHVQVFIPVTAKLEDFKSVWGNFLTEVAFSDYGKYQLAGLVQTFITMLNAVTLSGRGFSTLDVPVLTESQALVLAAWYRAVIRDVKKRQSERQIKIGQLQTGVANSDLNEKERKSQQKELDDKTAMQVKEAQKYTEYFRKSFIAGLQAQDAVWEELETIQKLLLDLKITKVEQKKLQKQQEKLTEKVSLSRNSIKQKLEIFKESGDDPFKFVELDEKARPERFSQISAIAKTFSKTATDQINSTRGDIFTQCISEMYRLLEMSTEDLDMLPPPLLTEQPIFPRVRSPGDDSKDFCYSCGMALDPKKARWQVLRFMFERPSQRRQSSSGEGRPHICISCAALSFASPLKVTDESIIVKLEAKENDIGAKLKIKDYVRMLTNKEMHLSAGRYLVLASERTSGGDLASQKLGQVQYALAKVASIFPVEVLSDFKFSLITQGTQLSLEGRHLVFLKGLMNCYRQFVASSKEVNMALGDAIRYVHQDLPYLADYRLTRESSYSTDFELEKVRGLYWEIFTNDLGDNMDSDNQIPKRARLYRDVAALTGLTYAFAQSLESTAKKLMKQDDAEREVSKLIEKVDDVIAFSYYATLGDEKKTSVQARLYKSPDSSFIYSQTKWLLDELNLLDREDKDDKGNYYLQLYADDISRAYQHFAISNSYAQERDWKELTYNLKLALYTRFPELVRNLKSTSEKN